MKIRSDFVTNSSSASFILELAFESEDGQCADMHLAVSPEVCFSADGDMAGENIRLLPAQRDNDVFVENSSIYSAKDIGELCDLLCATATIEGWRGSLGDDRITHYDLRGLRFAIAGALQHYASRAELAAFIEEQGGIVTNSVSSQTNYLICNDKASDSAEVQQALELGIPVIFEFSFMQAFDDERYEDYLIQYGFNAIRMSVKDVAPITIGRFKNQIAKAGITLDNLKTITVKNSKFGSGDSAMFIESCNDCFAAFRKKYEAAAEPEKAAVLEELIAFIKSQPELPVLDNEGMLPDKMCCVWDSSEECLKAHMTAFLAEGKDRHWMGTYANVFTIDVSGKTVTSREVLYFGDL